MNLNREQVLALAPDAASAKAAQGLTSESKWPLLGEDSEALWGECQGSGAKPYQTQVELASYTSRCSCPSRKFPCKHGLALLLISAAGSARLSNQPRPPWVDEWLAARQTRAERKIQAAETAAVTRAANPEAAAAATAKREADRWARIQAGASELETWIADQFRHGLGNPGPQDRLQWQKQAARLVDAQAPGLASRLQQLREFADSGSRSYQQLAEGLGLLALAASAVHHRDRLDEAAMGDLRAALGWTLEREDLLRDTPPVDDHWHVAGVWQQELEGRLQERRVWLRGRDTGRWALLQDYAHSGRGWDTQWLDGQISQARLHFHPSAAPLRAQVTEASPGSAGGGLPSTNGNALMVDTACGWFAANPLLPRCPLLLDSAIPITQGEAWAVQVDDWAVI